MTHFFAKSTSKTIQNWLLALLFSPIFVNAQAPDPTRIDWDQSPSRAQLDLTTWEVDSIADAVILNHDGWIRSAEIRNYYGFSFNERKRIKILKKSAFDRANIRLPFYHKDNREQIFNIKAHTWLPNGRKIEVTSKSIVMEKINERVTVAKFTFPQVTEGCILEYSYELESTYNFQLRDWFFQDDIPVASSILNLDIYSRYEYVFLTQGSIKTTQPKYSSDHRTQITFYGNGLPALRKEPFISTMDDYRMRISFQLSKYFDLQTGAPHQVLSDWERAAKDLNDDESFGKRLTRRFDNAWKALTPSLTEADTGMARVQKIYDFVNEHVAQNEYITWHAPQSGDEVFKKGKGTSGDINLLLTALLREAKIEADPALTSTRSNGRMHEPYPLLDQFNHTLVQVSFPDGRKLLLDGGNALRPMGVVRESALNSRAVVIRKKKAEWIDVKPPISSLTTSLNFIVDEEGTLSGTIQKVMKGYIAVREREKFTGDKTGKFVQKDWERENPDFKIDSVVFQNADNPKEALRESFKCSLPNALQNTNDLLYFKPILNSGWENTPFKIPTRYFPVDIPYPFQDQFILTLAVPKGYKVEEMPKAVALALPNKGGDFTYNIAQINNGSLQITVRIRLYKTFYAGEEYPSLKKFFDSVAEKLQEMVVLKKV